VARAGLAGDIASKATAASMAKLLKTRTSRIFIGRY